MAVRQIRERTIASEEKTGRRTRSVTVNDVESPLGWLRTRGHLSSRQFEAGERLRDDWEASASAPSVTMRWEQMTRDRHTKGAADGLSRSERQISAKVRFEEAVAAAGPGLSDILWRIVCAGEGMRDAETALGWPARAGKLVLAMALDRIADHYRIQR